MAGTMRAVVFKGPKVVAVESRSKPVLHDAGDIIVHVEYTALCGSELHVFRGHQPSPTGFIMGHEFTGIVTEVGEDVRSFQKGDQIVSPFTVSCGECFFCQNSCSSRCSKSLLFGSAGLDGGQAEYVRIPHADATVVKAPADVPPEKLVLMADIFPTGYFGVRNAFASMTPAQIQEATVVVIGCGPVGLCAVVNAADRKPKHLIAVDSIPSRLERARELGAEPWNFMTDREGLDNRVRELTDGRGADAVVEVVGMSPALRLGFDLLRPFGFMSSIGVHNAEIPWTGNEAYGKNLRIQMGRCPVRSVFPEALEQFKEKHDRLGFLVDLLMPLSDAVEGYSLFDGMKVQKIIFKAAE